MAQLKFLLEMMDVIEEDITQTRVSDRKYGGNLSDHRHLATASRRQELGDGAFSKVFTDPTDPHMVDKRSSTLRHVRGAKDGFNAFIEYLVKHDLMDNIHFPKVYNVDRVTGKDGKYRESYKVEKLIPLQKLSEEELDTLAEMNFPQLFENTPEEISSFIERSVINQLTFNRLKSESLKDAISIVKRAASELKFMVDLHDENIMVRRTSVGLQIVINDPLGYSSQ
jgi:hypothetical protein